MINTDAFKRFPVPKLQRFVMANIPLAEKAGYAVRHTLVGACGALDSAVAMGSLGTIQSHVKHWAVFDLLAVSEPEIRRIIHLGYSEARHD